MTQSEQFVLELIASQKHVLLGSVDEEGFPAVRALMRPRKYDDLRSLWFTTQTPSNKTRHLAANPKACLYVYDPVKFAGATLKGIVKLYDAAETKRQLWAPGDELFYPGGMSDPGYIALEFIALAGRLYSHRRSADFAVISPESVALQK